MFHYIRDCRHWRKLVGRRAYALYLMTFITNKFYFSVTSLSELDKLDAGKCSFV